jgi:hypothetical protein
VAEGAFREFHGKWSEKHTRDGVAIQASRLIFQYELSAALRALRNWKDAFPGQKVRMLIDNKGVVWALRNGCTRSARGQRMLDEAGEDLLGLIEEVIPLASEDNAADAWWSLTEKEQDDTRLWTAYDEWRAGGTEASRRWHEREAEARRGLVRHDGYDIELDDSERDEDGTKDNDEK